MSFVSFEVAALVLVTAVVLHALPPARRAPVLLAASVLFYLCSSAGGAAWLAVSTALTYVVGGRVRRMEEPRARIWVEMRSRR